MDDMDNTRIEDDNVSDDMQNENNNEIENADHLQVPLFNNNEPKKNNIKHKDELRVYIKRPALDQAAFDRKYEKENFVQPTIMEQIKKKCSKTSSLCTRNSLKKRFFRLFPVIQLLMTYQWKSWIISDMIAGLCVGVIHIPQCMGFALLTSLPPVYGLYSTIFPILIYFIFGTSRHISMGTMAIISIMIGSVVEREVAKFSMEKATFITTVTPSTIPLVNDNISYEITNESNPSILTIGNKTKIQNVGDELIQFKVGIAVSVTFLAGFIQILMSIFKLDIVATFMSMPFNGGFMVGAVFHIITSQVPFCLGVKIPRQSGITALPRNWYWILRSLPKANPPTVIISLISMLFLFICKEIINVRFKKRLKIPIPAELIVIIIATPISYFGNLSERYNVKIIENIPSGLPAPKVPSFINAETYIIDAFIIAVVSFAISMSMAKIFSQKYHYPIDQNQELFAMGMMHTITSFFHGFAGTQAPPRTLVHDSTGGKTQLASVFAALLVLLVVLAIGPLFEALPNCVLGAILIIALIPLLKKFQDLPQYWRVNKNDFVVWLTTFCCVVLLSIDMGLWIGLVVSLLTIALEHNRTVGKVLGKAGNTEMYISKASYKQLKDKSQKGIFVFKFDSPIYFANVDRFKKEIFQKTINPSSILDGKTLQDIIVSHDPTSDKEITEGDHEEHDDVTEAIEDPNHNNDKGDVDISEDDDDENDYDDDKSDTKSNRSFLLSHKKFDYLFENKRPKNLMLPIEMTELNKAQMKRNGTVILDCSSISYIDIMGLNCLKLLKSTYKEVEVDFVFADCSVNLLNKMGSHGIDINDGVYPSIEDAVLIAEAATYYL